MVYRLNVWACWVVEVVDYLGEYAPLVAVI